MLGQGVFLVFWFFSLHFLLLAADREHKQTVHPFQTHDSLVEMRAPQNLYFNFKCTLVYFT